MLKMFDTRDVQAFATELAEDLGRRFPPSSEARTDRGVTNQLKSIVQGLSARALRFNEEHPLGVYKKAKLANTFRWKLVEIGYSESFIERVTAEVVTRLASRPASDSKAASK